MKTYNIPVPYTNGVLMTAEQVLKFHDELTVLINENYDDFTGQIEAIEERNYDHYNDQKR